MPNRDYAARSKNKKSGNKFLILIIIILLLILSGLALLLLSDNNNKQPTVVAPQVQPQQPKSSLPSRPEEVYSYIKDLETREVPVDKNSKLAQLTKEQEQKILQQKEVEKRKLEQQAQAIQSVNQETENITESATPEDTQAALAKKAEEQRMAEEKRKQEELRKQQESKKVEQPKVVAAKSTTDAPKSSGKFGLQCGAFKSKAQAENMQARLAMAGYNARISSSADWNRVFVGPIGDRSAASAAQSNARSVAECLIIGM